MPYRGYPDVFPLSSLRNLRLDWFFDTQTQKRNVPPGKPDGQLVKKSLRVFCQAAFKIAKLFVVLFCNFAAAAGYLTRKETLTVPGLSNVPVLSLRGPAGAVAISQDCSEFQENLGEFETFYRRFPRRFAPRNDKAEALCHTEDTPTFSPCLPSETFGWTGFSTPRRKNEMYRPASRTVHFVEKKERERKKRKSMKKRGGAIYGRHRIRAGDCPARTAPAHWSMLLALRSAPHRPCCQTRWAGGTSCRSARW